MKITELKTHEFRTTTLQYDWKYGYWIYPIEMLQKGPRETTTTLLELVTDTGTSGYWIAGSDIRNPAPPPASWISELAVGENPMNRERLWQLSRGS